MHLLLQICGVVGFGFFGFMFPNLVKFYGGGQYEILDKFNRCSAIAFALISTYFIFG